MLVSEGQLVDMIPRVRDYVDIFYTVPSSVQELKERYLVSKLWRLNNLYSVVGKQVDGIDSIVSFKMNYAQLSLYASLSRHPRLVCLKSRQRGISTVTVLMLADDMFTLPHLNCGIIAQDQIAGDTLKDKISIAWDYLDDGIKGFFDIDVVIDNNSEFGMNNGSGCMAKLSFRSGTLHRLVWTEVGKICATDMARVTETKSGSLQTILGTLDNIVVLESTAHGDNDFKDTFDLASKMADKPITNKMYRPIFFSWLTDTDCTSDVEVWDDRVEKIVADIEREYSLYIGTIAYKTQIGNFIFSEGHQYKLSNTQRNWLVGVLFEMNFDLELFYREYPHTPESAFYVSNESLWYKDGLALLKRSNRLCFDKGSYDGLSALYNPDYEVFCFMDIGSTDLWYCGYVQIIDNGDVDMFGNPQWDYFILDVDFASYEKVPYFNDLIRSKPFEVTKLFLPHDGVHERAEGNSIETQFRDFGWDDIDIIPKTTILTGILNVRRKMSSLYIDMIFAGDIFDRLNDYKKKYNNKLRKYEAVPVHDDASHGADMVRYLMQSPESCRLIHQHSKFNKNLNSSNDTSSNSFSV